MVAVYVDADACPVKDETVAVATRHNLKVFMVSDGGIRPHQSPLVNFSIDWKLWFRRRCGNNPQKFVRPAPAIN